jgi:hypothetical protein
MSAANQRDRDSCAREHCTKVTTNGTSTDNPDVFKCHSQ